MELFLNNKHYKTMKLQFEKSIFKVFGKYVFFNPSGKLEHKSSQEVNEYFKNKIIEVSYQTTNHKGKTETVNLHKTFYEVWSSDPNMKEFQEIIFECNEALIRKGQFNSFRGCGYHLEDVKVDKTINLNNTFDHLRSLVNYNENHFKYLLDFFAQMIQQPHILPHVCLVFISAEGVGKDLFMNFMSEVISNEYYVNTAKIEQLLGRFNTSIGGKLMVVINESDPVETRERVDIIKEVTTAESLLIEGKYKDSIKCKNYARFIFLSNRLTAFPVEEGSRRPVIFQCSSKYTKEIIGAKANDAYFGPLINMYKDEKYQKLMLEYLKRRDISKFNPQLFEKTDLHKQLEKYSRSPIIEFLAKIVDIHANDVSFTMKSLDALNEYNELVKAHRLKYEYTQAKFNLELENKFKVKIGKSSVTTLTFNIGELKQILEKKYNYNFEEEKEEEPIEIMKEDLSVNVSLEDEIMHLQKRLRDAKIKQLQQLEEQCNKLKNPDPIVEKVGFDKYCEEPIKKQKQVYKLPAKPIKQSVFTKEVIKQPEPEEESDDDLVEASKHIFNF